MPETPNDTPLDRVNHPPHYTSHPSGVECIDIVEHLPFNVGNAIKYLWRAGLKDGAAEDLDKAAWYVAREIKRRKSVVDRCMVPSCRSLRAKDYARCARHVALGAIES